MNGSKFKELLRQLTDSGGAEIGASRSSPCLRCDGVLDQTWNGSFWQPTQCDACMVERKNEEHLFVKAAREDERREQLRKSGIPKPYQDGTLTIETYPPRNADDTKVYSAVRGWLTNRDDRFILFLHGKNGCGKSHLLFSAFEVLANQGEKCRVYRFVDLTNDLIEEMKQERDESVSLVKEVSSMPYLGIDDLGAAEKRSSFSIRVLSQIIDHRWRNALPTFITSHHSIDDLRRRLQPDGEDPGDVTHVLDRMSDAAFSQVIEMKGASHRNNANRVSPRKIGGTR